MKSAANQERGSASARSCLEKEREEGARERERLELLSLLDLSFVYEATLQLFVSTEPQLLVM